LRQKNSTFNRKNKPFAKETYCDSKKVKVKLSATGLNRLMGIRYVKTLDFLDVRHMKVVIVTVPVKIPVY
jgi:hypothetical protein